MKNEQQSQKLLLKVDPRSTFRNNFFQPATNVFVSRQVDHARWKTGSIDKNLQRNNVARQVEGFCASYFAAWHLSTEYRSILSADMATDTRPMCRPRLGRHIDRHQPISISADTRPILHCHSAATRPPLGRYFTNTRTTLRSLGKLLLLSSIFSTERGFKWPSSFFGL